MARSSGAVDAPCTRTTSWWTSERRSSGLYVQQLTHQSLPPAHSKELASPWAAHASLHARLRAGVPPHPCRNRGWKRTAKRTRVVCAGGRVRPTAGGLLTTFSLASSYGSALNGGSQPLLRNCRRDVSTRRLLRRRMLAGVGVRRKTDGCTWHCACECFCTFSSSET